MTVKFNLSIGTGHAPKDPALYEWITAAHTLEPRGRNRNPPATWGSNPFMDGDLIEIETDGLGPLHIQIRDELGRTRARESRWERNHARLTGKYAPQSQ